MNQEQISRLKASLEQERNARIEMEMQSREEMFRLREQAERQRMMFEMRELEWRNEKIRKEERERLEAERVAMRAEMLEMRSQINTNVVQSRLEIDSAQNLSKRQSAERVMSLEIENACKERDEVRARLENLTSRHHAYENTMVNEFEVIQTDLRLGQSDIGRHLENFVANATERLVESSESQRRELSEMQSRLDHIQSGIDRNTSTMWRLRDRRGVVSVADVVENVDDDDDDDDDGDQDSEDSDVSNTSEGKQCIDAIAKLLKQVDPTMEEDSGIEVDTSVLSRILEDAHGEEEEEEEEGLIQFNEYEVEPGEVPRQLAQFLESSGLYH